MQSTATDRHLPLCEAIATMDHSQENYAERHGRVPGSMSAMTTVDIADPFARQLMARYLSHRQQDLIEMRRAVANDDFDTIKLTGHNMHGSGSAYGLDRISELGAGLETAAIRQDRQAISDLIDDLERFVRELSIA